MNCPKPYCGGWISPIDLVKLEDRKYYDVVHKCNKCEYTEYHPLVEDKINKKIYVPFEKLYGTTIYEVYKDDIEKFFKDEVMDRYQYFTRKDGIQISKGFIWIAVHKNFATLTVEPMDGNQFEIAVRFLKDEEERHDSDYYSYEYAGYSICEMPFVMIGKGTGGH